MELSSKPGGWSKLTRTTLAQAVGCSDAIVNVHIGDMPTVRRAVMRIAVRRGLEEIIVQSLIAHDGYAPKNATLTSILG